MKKLITIISTISSLRAIEYTTQDWLDFLSVKERNFHISKLSDSVNADAPNYKTKGPQTVHIVPHSHDDVGWLKTVDQYYLGVRNDIQHANVRRILNNVVRALSKNSNRKFMEVEMKFFRMWWDEQNEQTRLLVKQLVKDGQLELVNGGWSMHDEACPIYDDMINNMQTGHDFILKEFGVKPRIGWQIDPFGHSNTNVRFFAEMGFDAVFQARIDHLDLNNRRMKREMEYVHIPSSDNLGNDIRILEHVLFYHYSSPGNFSLDDGKVWDMPKHAQYLLKDLSDRTKFYVSNEIFVLFGNDFSFSDAEQDFQNIDNLIEYMNKHHGDKYFLKYSTPSNYVDALAKLNITWPVKKDDGFPYSSGLDQYWSGYFTSRPNSKEYIRRASGNMFASSQLMALKMLDQSLSQAQETNILQAYNDLSDELGVVQHHDAVTGTEREKVAFDYNFRLSQGMDTINSQYGQLLAEKVKMLTYGGESRKGWHECQRTNSTYLDCPIAAQINDQKNFEMTLAIHNPSSINVTGTRIAVPDAKFSVQSVNPFSGNFVQEDIAYSECFDDRLISGKSIKNCYIVVPEIQIPAYGINLLNIKRSDKSLPGQAVAINAKPKEKFFLQEGDLQLYFEKAKDSTLYFKLKNTFTKKTEKFQVSLKYWNSFVSDDEKKQNSGPYIFRPAADQYEPYPYTKFKSGLVQKHSAKKNSDGFHFYFQDKDLKTKESIKRALIHVDLDKTTQAVRVDVDLDSLPIDATEYKGKGQEVVVEFHVENFDNGKTFYTDSNGLELQKRKLNYRPTWDLAKIDQEFGKLHQNISANYYPVDSMICMQDKTSDRWFSVMNDRSQGGSALKPGTIELMQNRQLPKDDHQGVGIPLQEKDQFGHGVRVRATYYVQIGPKAQSKARQVQQLINSPVQQFFNFNFKKNSIQIFRQSSLASDLQHAGVTQDIKLYLQPVNKNSIRLRMTNLHDYNHQKVNLKSVLQAYWKEANRANPVSYTYLNTTQMSLSGNIPLSQMLNRKIKWRAVGDKNLVYQNVSRSWNFDLKPQEIRTFQVNFQQAVPNYLQNK